MIGRGPRIPSIGALDCHAVGMACYIVCWVGGNKVVVYSRALGYGYTSDGAKDAVAIAKS